MWQMRGKASGEPTPVGERQQRALLFFPLKIVITQKTKNQIKF
jgi:hypothetical protein